jgi:hypothetical protein
MKWLTVGQLNTLSYNPVRFNTGQDYLILNEKTKEIIAKIRFLKPPKEFNGGKTYRLKEED